MNRKTDPHKMLSLDLEKMERAIANNRSFEEEDAFERAFIKLLNSQEMVGRVDPCDTSYLTKDYSQYLLSGRYEKDLLVALKASAKRLKRKLKGEKEKKMAKKKAKKKSKK
jgi:tRNA(Phe) wybutosine-synthesizing methylase Tyw3